MIARLTRPARRGIASFTAVAMLVLIGFTLIAMAHAFRSQVKRTQDYRQEAQLRQLLLAGETVLAGRDEPIDAPTDLPLPAGVRGDGWTLRAEPWASDPGALRLTASSAKAEAAQLLTLRDGVVTDRVLLRLR